MAGSSNCPVCGSIDFGRFVAAALYGQGAGTESEGGSFGNSKQHRGKDKYHFGKGVIT